MIAIIDIGGTSIKYGIINTHSEKYTLLGKTDTNANEANFKIEDRLDIILQSLLDSYVLSGIAISTAGIVDTDKGVIVHANENLPNYKGTKLKDKLEEKYQIPVSVENDVNAALLGEIEFGKYHNIHSAVMITIGTGIGGALFINNQIFHGFSHGAGEIGYSTFDKVNIEKLASTTSLVENVRRRLNHTSNEIDGNWIFNEAIHKNNIVCVEEIENLIENLIELINNIISLVNPEVVILGGGIMEQTEYLRPRIKSKIQNLDSNSYAIKNTKLDFASLGNSAGMLGAYAHFKKHHI